MRLVACIVYEDITLYFLTNPIMRSLKVVIWPCGYEWEPCITTIIIIIEVVIDDLVVGVVVGVGLAGAITSKTMKI